MKPARRAWPLATCAWACAGLLPGVASAALVEPVPSLLTAFAAESSAFPLRAEPAPSQADSPLLALSSYLRAGWQTTLSTRAHGVRGTVTIVDADTFRVDNFFYDGGGIDVHFILAASDDNNTFRTTRLVTTLNLLGTAHNGDSLTIDLPAGTNFDGYNAISLWCLPAQANFGSGTFANPVPEPATTGLLLFGLATFSLRARQRSRGSGSQPRQEG